MFCIPAPCSLSTTLYNVQIIKPFFGKVTGAFTSHPCLSFTDIEHTIYWRRPLLSTKIFVIKSNQKWLKTCCVQYSHHILVKWRQAGICEWQWLPKLFIDVSSELHLNQPHGINHWSVFYLLVEKLNNLIFLGFSLS